MSSAPENKETVVTVARLEQAVVDLTKLVGEMKTIFVTKHEFEPVRYIVYGGCGAALLAMLTALIAMVVRAGGA